jgi:hypothetical protein
MNSRLTTTSDSITDSIIDSIIDSLRQAKNWDDKREAVPGEHWLALAAGLALVLACNRSPSTLTRVAGSALGAALVLRAASGRDGVTKLLPYVPGVRDMLS